MKTFYSLAVLARELGVSRSTVQRMLDSKRIEEPAVAITSEGVRKPIVGFSDQQIARLVANYQMLRGKDAK